MIKLELTKNTLITRSSMFEKIVYLFLPQRMKAKETNSIAQLEDRRKAATTIYFIMAGSTLAFVMFFVRLSMEGMESSKTLLLLPIAGLLNLLILYICGKFDKLVVAAWYVVIAVTSVLFFRTLSTGGVVSSVAVWLIIIPITATITISRAAGLFSAIVCCLLIIAVALHDKIGLKVNDIHPSPLMNGSVLIIALCLIAFLISIYEKERLKSVEKISQFEKDLAHSRKLASIGSISSGLAHEINNPMTVVSGNFEIMQMLLERDPIDLEKLKKHENLITKNLKRINSVVEAFRTYSRSDYKESFQILDPMDVVQSSLDLVEKSSIPIVVEGSCEGKFSGNKGLIERVFHNLLINAIYEVSKHDSPWIKINIKEDSSYVYISFTDSGKGIPEEVREKVFDPFYTTKDIGEGSGMGLSLSQNIVAIHEAKLSINPKSKNTQFILRFNKIAA